MMVLFIGSFTFIYGHSYDWDERNCLQVNLAYYLYF